MTYAQPSWAVRIAIGIGLTALCFAGPTVQVALADDGTPVPAPPELADALVGAALETVSELSAAEPVLPVPVEALPQAPVTEEPVLSAATPLEAAPATEAPDPPEPAVPAEAAPPEQPPVEAAATQTQPQNVNVAVRVDSPGDNGPVAQVNAATTAVAEAPPASGVEQYQPSPAQYQPPQASAEPPAAAPASSAPGADEPGWTWTWTCGGSVTDVLAASDGNSLLPTNWSWNWNWNCGEDEDRKADNYSESEEQYHAGVTQYQPVNLNVSIRIGSPGNDGPVTQSNVAAVVALPPMVSLPSLPVPMPTPPSSISNAGDAGQAASGPVVLTLELASLEIAASVEAADAVEWIFRGVGGAIGIEPAAADRAGHGLASVRSPLVSQAGAPEAAQPELASVTTSASAWAVRAVEVVGEQATVRPDRPARIGSPRKPSRRPLPPMRAPVLTSGFAGATPGGTDGGGWPLLALLLVPFSLALVDSARRMGRDAALPAAAEPHTRRERPG